MNVEELVSENRIEGTFEPPTMGVSDVPIQIVGAGSLAIEDAGVRVRGIKAKSAALLTFALYLVTFVVFSGTLMALSIFTYRDSEERHDLSRWQIYVAIGLAVATWTGGSSIVKKKKLEASSREPETIDVVVPFASIPMMFTQDDGVFMLRIKKFSPKGGLFFRAARLDQQATFLDALEARGVARKVQASMS